ncbi:MAG: ABC transporter ATP-binding protein [Gammaproteobacteria bacterium]|nr:ABC transporter ATP-binding protein [Gammaproteobacteria bacterium]
MAGIDDKLLSAKKLGINVPGRNLVEALDVDFLRGEFVAVLGRNGVGKTLSILTMAGLRQAQGGDVILGDDNIFSMPRSAVATKLALLPQSVDDIFPATVLDTVLIGRHPHIPRFQWETDVDRDIAFCALRQMDIADLAGRDVLTLSGGERRRLAAAQILAQSPAVYLLDEPTNHLDPQHQLDVLTVFRKAANDGACVIASLHDVNLAARFADRCLLLFGDGRWELGTVDEILTEPSLEALYGTPIETIQWRSQRLFVVAGNA